MYFVYIFYMDLINFLGVTKRFGNFVVLDNLNFNVKKGDLIGLIGKSGEGKSTFLKVLIGFYDINSGKILYNGSDITRKNKLSKIVGFCTQENSFYENLTIDENLKYYGKLYNITRIQLKKRIEELLDMVSLIERRNAVAGNLSGGMKRRLDFAISLLHNPELLILDEPTAGLDPLVRKNIEELIEKINNSGKTIIISSHMLDFIENKCKTIALLSKGKLNQINIDLLRKRYPKKSLNDIFPYIVKS